MDGIQGYSEETIDFNELCRYAEAAAQIMAKYEPTTCGVVLDKFWRLIPDTALGERLRIAVQREMGS